VRRCSLREAPQDWCEKRPDLYHEVRRKPIGLESAGLGSPQQAGAASSDALIQLSDELLAELDARAAREGRSRSELIREALTGYLHGDRERELDRRIVEGYTLRPQEDLLAAERVGRAMIAAEPWEPSRRQTGR